LVFVSRYYDLALTYVLLNGDITHANLMKHQANICPYQLSKCRCSLALLHPHTNSSKSRFCASLVTGLSFYICQVVAAKTNSVSIVLFLFFMMLLAMLNLILYSTNLCT